MTIRSKASSFVTADGFPVLNNDKPMYELILNKLCIVFFLGRSHTMRQSPFLVSIFLCKSNVLNCYSLTIGEVYLFRLLVKSEMNYELYAADW